MPVTTPVVIALPIGEPADDGVPEPLQFVLNEGLRLMLVPTGGFGWVIGAPVPRWSPAPGDSPTQGTVMC